MIQFLGFIWLSFRLVLFGLLLILISLLTIEHTVIAIRVGIGVMVGRVVDVGCGFSVACMVGSRVGVMIIGADVITITMTSGSGGLHAEIIRVSNIIIQVFIFARSRRGGTTSERKWKLYLFLYFGLWLP